MSKLFSFLLISCALILFASCGKDEGKLPNIAFKTGAGYTSADATVPKGTIVTMGIAASKSEDKDVLKTFDCSQTYDVGTAISIYSETLTASKGDNYNKDITITTRNIAGKEKYVFTVVNKDGLKNSVNLTLTVN